MENSGAHVPHLVRAVFAILARLFPYHPPADKQHVTLEQLKPRFARWDLRVTLLLFLFAPFTVWGSKIALNRVFATPPSPAGALYHVTADPAFFLLPALFLGLIIVALPVMATLRLLQGRACSDYLLYGNLLVGFDTVKVWWAIAALVAVAAGVLAAAVAPVHFDVFPDRVEARHIGFGPAKSYPFSSVTKLSNTEEEVVLTFTDGATWSTSGDWGVLSLSPEAVHYLSARINHTP